MEGLLSIRQGLDAPPNFASVSVTSVVPRRWQYKYKMSRLITAGSNNYGNMPIPNPNQCFIDTADANRADHKTLKATSSASVGI